MDAPVPSQRRCAACCQMIKEPAYYTCTKCKNRLHKKCLYDSVLLDAADGTDPVCICSECKSKAPKGNNTNTPLRDLQRHSTDDQANVTLRRKNTLKLDATLVDPELENVDMKLLLLEMREIKDAVDILTKQNQEIALLRKEVRELKNQLGATDDHSQVLAARDDEIAELRSSVAQLQNSLRVQEQQSLRNEMEIAGVPEHDNENLSHVVLLISKKVGLELTETDIDGIFRAGPKKVPKVPATDNKMPRPIVVKLVRQAKRGQFIKAARARTNITSEGIVTGTATSLFFNERLTKENRILFRDARQRSKIHNFRFCWVRDGCIYVRKAEKKPAIPIRSENDLDQHVGIAT